MMKMFTPPELTFVRVHLSNHIKHLLLILGAGPCDLDCFGSQALVDSQTRSAFCWTISAVLFVLNKLRPAVDGTKTKFIKYELLEGLSSLVISTPPEAKKNLIQK